MSLSADRDQAGMTWQRGIWDRYPAIYQQEVDRRFVPVVQQVLRRAALAPGQQVLDLGTGTGSVALQAASLVAPRGDVWAVDSAQHLGGRYEPIGDDFKGSTISVPTGAAQVPGLVDAIGAAGKTN